MRIICIRHGQTTGDVEDRYGGSYNDHLSEEGKKQVAALREELATKKIETLISSPLIRTRETSTIISRGAIPVVIEEDFQERNQYGILTGLIKGQAKYIYPDLVEQAKDRLNTLEDAESYVGFSNRIQIAFDRVLLDHSSDCIGIVWHGGPLRVLFRDILKMGELGKEIGDCAWVELEKEGSTFKILDSKRLEFLF